MNLTVPVPESATVTAAAVVTAAAGRAGYTPEHEGTAQAFLSAHLAEYVHQLYKSAMIDAELARVEEAVPRPERPRVREAAGEPRA